MKMMHRGRRVLVHHVNRSLRRNVTKSPRSRSAVLWLRRRASRIRQVVVFRELRQTLKCRCRHFQCKLRMVRDSVAGVVRAVALALAMDFLRGSGRLNGTGRASGGGFAAAGGSASGTASSQAGGAQMLPLLGDSGFGDMPRMPLGFGPQAFASGLQGDQVSVSKSTRSDEEGAVTIVNVLTKTEEVSIRSSESEGVEVRVRKLSKATKSERETGKRRSKETGL